jgi:exodeoxyribonuclease-1
MAYLGFTLQMEKSIYWYDLETFGSDPQQDRACQFAGVRTDEQLNVIDEPLLLYCQPSLDTLPQPEACLITGITPKLAEQKGLKEAEFAARIQAEFSEPGTCVAGYNNLRFDDEVMRQLFYRNFYDPYEREWKNGNSRWDIIDLLRMCHALRPEGIKWPLREDGATSFRLEALTEANRISHEGAHDALSDVYATISMAKLVREKQAKLYDFYYRLRDKHAVLAMLDLKQAEPVLHISSRYPASRACMAPVIPLMLDPGNPNGFIVYDLSQDPRQWIEESIETIQYRLFTPSAELPEGNQQIALKTLHSNRCPALAPLSVLTKEIMQRYEIDLAQCEEHRQILLEKSGLQEKLGQVFSRQYPEESNPDRMLYSGGFFDQYDRQGMSQVLQLDAEELASFQREWNDTRLPELLFRYRCRNFPDSISPAERARWLIYCREKVLNPVDKDRSVQAVLSRIDEKIKNSKPAQKLVLEELTQYIARLCNDLGIEAR